MIERNNVGTVSTPGGKKITVGIITPQYEIGRTKYSRHLVPVYDSRIIGYIAEIIKERVRKEFDCPILITGERRTGKSTLAMEIAEYINHRINTDFIAFRLDDFNKILHENPYADPKNGIYPQVALDEAGYDLFSQSWMERVQRNLVKKFEVIGIKNQIVYFILPHRMKLNKGIREEMPYLWINVSTFNGIRGFAELRQKPDKPNIWEEKIFWKPVCGFVFDDMSNNPLWAEYETKKRIFVNEVTAETESCNDIGYREKRIIDQRNLIIKAYYETNKVKQSTIAELLGMEQQSISRIICHA